MRILIGVASLFLGATGAYAAPSCQGSLDLLQVSDWSISPIDEDTNSLSVTLSNSGDNAIRMIDGSVAFQDALGGHIASYSIDRDAQIEAHGSFEETGRWGPYTFERLLKLKADEVEAYACVRAVLFADGSKEEF